MEIIGSSNYRCRAGHVSPDVITFNLANTVPTFVCIYCWRDWMIATFGEATVEVEEENDGA